MSDYSELKRKADIALSGGFLEQEEFRSHCRASVIGRLIEEREQFHKQFEIEREFKLKTYEERDQLKAENERLERNRDMWKGQVERQDEDLTALHKDADKWKIVERAMESLKSDERNASIWTVCSRLLISTAHKLNSSTSTVVEEGVTIGDLEIGDWRVTVERIDASLVQGEKP